ncbi:MAG: hypothetical protein FWF88_11095, partial [Peptococcaceae bacterium]|nr:hypothetical protein [Peptococcaceae bacterium]
MDYGSGVVNERGLNRKLQIRPIRPIRPQPEGQEGRRGRRAAEALSPSLCGRLDESLGERERPQTQLSERNAV